MSGSEIEHEFELHRLFDRQVARLRTFQNLVERPTLCSPGAGARQRDGYRAALALGAPVEHRVGPVMKGRTMFHAPPAELVAPPISFASSEVQPHCLL